MSSPYTFFNIDSSSLDEYSTIECDHCKKTMIVKEVEERLIEDVVYNLCSFCKDYFDFTIVKEAYNAILMQMWTGLENKPIDYIP